MTKHKSSHKPAKPSRKAKVVVQQPVTPDNPPAPPARVETPFAGEPVANGLTRFWKWFTG